MSKPRKSAPKKAVAPKEEPSAPTPEAVAPPTPEAVVEPTPTPVAHQFPAPPRRCSDCRTSEGVDVEVGAGVAKRSYCRRCAPINA